MKKTFFSLLVLLTCSLEAISAQSPIIDLGIFKKAPNGTKLEIRLRAMEDVVNGAYSGGIFTVRFPSAYGVTLSAVPNTALYSYAFAGPVGQSEGYDYYRFQFAGSVNTVNWEKGKQYPLITLQVNGTPPPRAIFELVTNNEWTRANNANFYQELNGVSLERDFYKLPNKVVGLDATALPSRRVQLDWTYEAGEKLAYSEVEYSADGQVFKMISRLPAKSETDRGSSEFKYEHNSPQSGVNYYQIWLTDINGEVEYTPIRVINFDDMDADFNVFPNPTAGPLTLVSRNLAQYEGGIRYQIIDNSGKVLLANNVADDNVTIDLSKLASGAYYLQINNDEKQLEKFQVVIAN